MQTKLESPHPELQAVLPWLAALNGRRQTWPVFRTAVEAEVYCQTRKLQYSMDLTIQPVWNLNHDDLLASEAMGWTIVSATH